MQDTSSADAKHETTAKGEKQEKKVETTTKPVASEQDKVKSPSEEIKPQHSVQPKPSEVKIQQAKKEIKVENTKKTIRDLFSVKPQQAKSPLERKPTPLQPKPTPPQEVKKVKIQQVVPQPVQETKAQIKMSISDEKPKQKEEKQIVKIKITDTVQKGLAINKHFVYTIEGRDQHGSFKITRKYEEFKALRKLLKDRWPGCFVPAVTSKSSMKHKEQREWDTWFLLQNFLKGLSYSAHLYYKEEVQLFLRSPHIEIKQMVEKMPILKSGDLMSRFNSCFGQSFFENKSQTGNALKIKQFSSILKNIVASLQNMSGKMLILNETYSHYAHSLSKFSGIAQQYQKLCLAEYTDKHRDKTIIIKDAANHTPKLSCLTTINPFLKLYNFINNEARDAEAFLETIIAIDLFTLRSQQIDEEVKKYQKAIEEIGMGHKTIKTVTSRRPPEEIKEELQQKQKKLLDQKEAANRMFTMTETVLGKLEIDIFKKFKNQTYRNVLDEWATSIEGLTPQLEAVWHLIHEQSRTLLK